MINSCIRNLLKLISVLQDNSLNTFCSNDGCTKPFLGPSIEYVCYNTRVVSLYNKFGNILMFSFTDNDGNAKTTSTFRIHNVDEECCTLLLLDNDDSNFISTKQYVTVNINCICAVKCIEDVVIDNL